MKLLAEPQCLAATLVIPQTSVNCLSKLEASNSEDEHTDGGSQDFDLLAVPEGTCRVLSAEFFMSESNISTLV